MGQLPCRTARSIGDRNKRWLQRLQPGDVLVERLGIGRRLGRKELKRKGRLIGRENIANVHLSQIYAKPANTSLGFSRPTVGELCLRRQQVDQALFKFVEIGTQVAGRAREYTSLPRLITLISLHRLRISCESWLLRKVVTFSSTASRRSRFHISRFAGGRAPVSARRGTAPSAPHQRARNLHPPLHTGAVGADQLAAKRAVQANVVEQRST